MPANPEETETQYQKNIQPAMKNKNDTNTVGSSRLPFWNYFYQKLHLQKDREGGKRCEIVHGDWAFPIFFQPDENESMNCGTMTSRCCWLGKTGLISHTIYEGYIASRIM